jgi:hypothetical protein
MQRICVNVLRLFSGMYLEPISYKNFKHDEEYAMKFNNI